MINVKNKPHTVTPQVEVPPASGVIIAQGGAFGGWALYTKDGKPTYCHNLLGLQRSKVKADKPVRPGAHQVGMEFDYKGVARQRRPGPPLQRRQPCRRGRAPGDCATDLLRG